MALNFCLHSLLVFIISFTTIAACPENGNCETCNLKLSVNKESVNDVIRISPQDLIAFDQNFQQQPHSGFTFTVNGVVFNPNNRNSDFPCTEEADASSVTQTLHVRYHCIAVQPGSYGINASVHYCDKDYQAQNQFTVIVENGNMSTLDLPTPSPSISLSTLLSIPSSTVVSPVPSTLNPSPTRSLQSSSTPMAMTPSVSSSGILNSTNTPLSPPLAAENDSNIVIIVIAVIIICALTGLILIVLLIILLLKCGKRRRKNVLEQPTPDPLGDHPINLQTQGHYTSAVSEISTEDSGSDLAASDFSTPGEELMSVSYANPEQVVTSETVTSRKPEDAITPHQEQIMILIN